MPPKFSSTMKKPLLSSRRNSIGPQNNNMGSGSVAVVVIIIIAVFIAFRKEISKAFQKKQTTSVDQKISQIFQSTQFPSQM